MKHMRWIAAAAASILLAACGGGSIDIVHPVKVAGDSLADSGTFGFKFTVQGNPIWTDLVADAVYGGAAEGGLQRQALHAFALQFVHPITGQDLALRAPPPDDFLTAAEKLGLQYNCPP